MQDLQPFFDARHFIESEDGVTYDPLQLGSRIRFATADNFDLGDAEIVIVGCGEQRGRNRRLAASDGPDAIRRQLYRFYDWQPGLKIADAGNIRQGKSLDDTRAALRMVLEELHAQGRIVIVLGGSHDLTMQQYDAFKSAGEVINAVVADARIDLDEQETITDRSFLLEMLTGTPNFVRHYSHLGFQSYFVHPHMLETLDKLRFDFHRVGRLREQLDEAEPALRGAGLFSFDMSAVRFGDCPANAGGSPNGFGGEDACALTRYAGAASDLRSFGIYGYDPKHDTHEMSAILIAQMIWYFFEGVVQRKNEAPLEDRAQFAEFHVRFTSNDTTFLKSRRTGRWWMELPEGQFVPCSYGDYQTACQDEIPERWLREQERLS